PARPAPSPPAVLLAWTPSRLDDGLATTAASLPAARATSVVRGGVVDLVGSRDMEGRVVDGLDAGWAIPLDAAAVAPADHAAFVPLADRATVAELGAGEALLGRTSAELRRLSPGGVIDLAGGQSVVVAGVVEDATIGGAELAVDLATGERIGLDRPRYVLVAYDGDRSAVEDALRSALAPGVSVRFRGPGETPFLRHGDAVLAQAQIKARFGEFSLRRRAGARAFDQDPRWQAEYIVTQDVPILGRVTCHRAIVPALVGALREIENAGLGGLVDQVSYDGCWNPRLVQPGAGVSRHAWGVAFDLGFSSNPTGFESVQDPRIVEVFRRWGFTSGDGWLVPDAGHFEFVSPPQR
ncbi:MAG TPA: M15 family metallopeptidase, partial [Acidimicrobiales bacterium]|nr:M15 family metallopeptidase [Acidimicrobiales bacterium]